MIDRADLTARDTAIRRDQPASPMLDYSGLMRTAIRRAQTHSGDLWTDYNEHDPGVTILEQLCYALTDLAYRTHHPVADILATPPPGRLGFPVDRLSPAARDDAPVPQCFPTGDRILTSAPVTVSDHRRLVFDRVEGLRNVWLERAEVSGTARGRGRWKVLVEVFDERLGKSVEDSAVRRKRRIVEEVSAILRTHRPLGEDFESFEIVEDPLVIHTRLRIAAGLNHGDVVAAALSAADIEINPPPAMASIDLALNAGTPPDEIYRGPRLDRGFLDDAALARRPPRTLQELTRMIRVAMARVDGVVAVEGLRVEPLDGRRQTVFAYPRIDIAASLDAIFGEDQGDSPQQQKQIKPLAQASVVHRRQSRRFGITYTARQPKRIEYESPRLGRRRPTLATYRSIQHLFPSVYGLGEDAAPPLPGAPGSRADLDNLRAYLAVFEQLLADALQQLGHAPSLFAFGGEPLGPTYFTASLIAADPRNDAAPGLRRILIGGGEPGIAAYRSGLEGIAGNLDPHALPSGGFASLRSANQSAVAARRPHLVRWQKAADHLLARFGEGFVEQRPWPLRAGAVAEARKRRRRILDDPDSADAEVEALERGVRDRRAFLTDIEYLGGWRGTGASYPAEHRDAPLGGPRDPVPALARRIELFTGLPPDSIAIVENLLLRPHADAPALTAVNDGSAVRMRVAHGAPIDAVLHPELDAFQGDWKRFAGIARRASFKGLGTGEVELRLGDDQSRTVAVIVPRFRTAHDAREAAGRVARLLQDIRVGVRPDPAQGIERTLMPGFFDGRVSILVRHPMLELGEAGRPSGREPPGPASVEEFVEKILHANLPAHLTCRCLWLKDLEIAGRIRALIVDWRRAIEEWTDGESTAADLRSTLSRLEERQFGERLEGGWPSLS